MYIIKLADKEISYSIKISKLARQISLKLHGREVRVVIPSKRFEQMAHQFVQEKLQWIASNLPPIVSLLHDGASLKILGEEFTIRHEQWVLEKTRVGELNNIITVYTRTPNTPDAELKISEYLRKKYSPLIKYRVAELAQDYGFKYQSISIRDQSSRWGSCSNEQKLNFSWRLILAPVEVLDYVIVHELAHTVHMDHSANFWDLVAKFQPNYKQHRLWLKRNQDLLKAY
jgi:hypothetical protein